MKTSIAACAVLPLFAASAFAEDRSVPGEHPTIAAAVAAAQQGDRILVAPGVYRENVVASVPELQILGVRAVWDGTLTDGSPGVCLTVNAAAVVVRGFTFRAGETAVAQVQVTGDDFRVSNCVSRGPAGRFLSVAGHRAVVDRCGLFAVNSGAIEITGDDALVQRLTAQQCDDDVVRVVGTRATVTKCRFQSAEDGFSVDVDGVGARVTSNRFFACDEAISVTGDNALVEGNRLLYGGEISVTGDNLAILRNSIAWAPDEDDGIVADSNSPTGTGVIEGNVVTDVAGFGLDIAADNLTVGRNRIARAGIEGAEGGCRITGSGNRLVGVLVEGAGAHGFSVGGNANVLEDCVAVDCAADGFHVTGDAVKLDRCRAGDNSGEGLDNGGAGTIVTGCVFARNRIDVANDGAFADFSASNVFGTGGVAQMPQVD